MLRKFAQPSLLFKLLATVLVSAGGSAIAANDAQLKAAFLNLSSLQRYKSSDCEPPEGQPWRITQAPNSLVALNQDEAPPIVHGTASAGCSMQLSVAQRQALYEASKKSTMPLWVVYSLRSWQLEVIQKNGKLTVDFVDLRPVALPKAVIEKKPPLLATSVYTQKDFEADAYKRDFVAWQERFSKDGAELVAKAKANPDYVRGLLGKEPDKLNEFFSRSVHSGPKGDALRKLFVEAVLSRDRRVLPTGATVAKLVSGDNAKPVGFGGTFSDTGNTVELWYVVFDDMSGWTTKTLEESIIFSAFSPLQLPAHKVIKRDSWPALVFIRNADSNIKLYALSSELARIVEKIFNAQAG